MCFKLFEKAGETSRPPVLRRPGSRGAQAPWDGGQGSDPGGDGEGAVRNLVWGWAPCCAAGYPQAVPAPPLAGARVQPDKDRLLFCVKKSIIPSDAPAIGGEVHSTSWRGRRRGGQGQGSRTWGPPALPGRYPAVWWGRSTVDSRPRGRHVLLLAHPPCHLFADGKREPEVRLWASVHPGVRGGESREEEDCPRPPPARPSRTRRPFSQACGSSAGPGRPAPVPPLAAVLQTQVLAGVHWAQALLGHSQLT